MLYRPFLILFIIQQGTSLSSKSTTTLYGGAGSISCTGDSGISWTTEDNVTISDSEDGYSVTVVDFTSTLTKATVTETTKFKCSDDSSNSAIVTIYVATIAGVSSPLCKKECEVSCTLDQLLEDATSVQWSGMYQNGSYYYIDSGQSKTLTSNGISTVLKHRADKFEYTSHETYLTILNLEKTSHFTCIYHLADESTIRYTVSALIRDTSLSNPSTCDMLNCTTKDRCHSADILNSNTTCLQECIDCFTYNYTIGDFIDSGGQCEADGDWCKAYLNSRKRCSVNKDPVVTYCDQCGYCLDLEFTPNKIILPAIILAALCMLTILMCYKSYDEKRSILPKVHITNTEPALICDGKEKFVPQVSLVAENSAFTDEAFKLKVKSKCSNVPEIRPLSQTV